MIAEEMLQDAEQPRAQLAILLLRHQERVLGDEAVKEGLRQILRIVRRVAFAAQVGVNGIPVAFAQHLHRAGRLVRIPALHSLDERPVRGGEVGVARMNHGKEMGFSRTICSAVRCVNFPGRAFQSPD